jgi:NAD(P)H-flavin reductase
MPQQYTAKLSDKDVLNEKFIHLYFELNSPHLMEFQAGQYVSIAMPEGGLRRSYSICSSPEKTHGFELLVDISPDGIGSKYLNSLQFGQEISFLGPLGKFIVPEENTEDALVFVGTGSGMAPFRSMIFDQLQQKKDTRKMILHWGLRFEQDLFWEADFQQLSVEFPNFSFHPVLSKAGQEWPLCRGRVTDCLQIHEPLANAGYYLCGNAGMLQDVVALLEKKGVEKEKVHHEKFH